MKKLLCFTLVLALALLAACSPSGGSDKVYQIRKCSFVLPASWSDELSIEDNGQYNSEDDGMAVTVSYDDTAVSLPDLLKDEEYEVGSVTVDGEETRLFTFMADGYYCKRFIVERPDGAYSFTVISEEENPQIYEQFLQSIKFDD